MSSMSTTTNQHIVPKRNGGLGSARRRSLSNNNIIYNSGDDDGNDIEEPQSARSRKRMTAIACYQCRRRKCKCDGKQPCGNCVRRNTDCVFDSVSGSVHTEDLKVRIRDLESQARVVRGRNIFLEDQVRRLTTSLANAAQIGPGPLVSPALGDPEVWPSPSLSMSSTTPTYSTESSPHTSIRPSDGQPPQHYANNMQPRSAARNIQQSHPQTLANFTSLPYQCQQLPAGYTASGPHQETSMRRTSSSASNSHNRFSNGALKIFLTQHRVALENGEDPHIILNSGLDVGPLIDPSRPMTEWSSWALQLPLSAIDMSFCSKLACAYVTYHQLRWLIYPTQENYNKIPSFVKPMVAQLCIPHPVWIHLMIRDALHSSKVLVTDVQHGTNASRLPNLLSSRLKQWDRPMSEATMFNPQNGHTRLTPDFEAYVKEPSNWQPTVLPPLPAHVAAAPAIVSSTRTTSPTASSNYYQPPNAPYA